jgi:hypothetical protein
MAEERDWLGDYAIVGSIAALLVGVLLAVLLS